MKKLIVLFLAMLCITGCSKQVENADVLKTAVISTADGGEATLNLLNTSTVATLTAEKINGNGDLSKYDAVYIDKSVIEMPSFKADSVMEYVKKGGSVFVDNEAYGMFTPEFIGASEMILLTSAPTSLYYPDIQDNSLRKIQTLIKDYDIQPEGNYGVGLIPSTAQTLAEKDGVSIYSMNKYGDGYVFFTNPLLTGNETANKLLRDYFAEFVSLKKYGYAIEKVYGSFASPAASWSVAIDDMASIANNSANVFLDLCKPYGQIASFKLAKSPYIKNHYAESVTYALNDNGVFTSEEYESPYTSGKHFVSNGKWLTLDTDEVSGVKRACPYPTDFNNDGLMDLICGSADGMLYYFKAKGMGENYEFDSPSSFTDLEGNRISVGAYSSPSMTDMDNDGIIEILCGSDDGQIHCYKPIGGLILEDMGVILETGMIDAMTATGDLNGDGICDLAIGSCTGEMRVYYGDMAEYGISYNEYAVVDSSHTWCAPCIGDLDGDGLNELYAGTPEGNIAGFNHQNTFMGYIEAVTFGANSVPRIYDVNGDGKNDLIIGALEYGMAMPADSEYFPYRNEVDALEKSGLLWDNTKTTENVKLSAMYGMPLIFGADVSEDREVLSDKINNADALADDYGYSFVQGNQLQEMVEAVDNTRVNAKWENDGLSLSAVSLNEETTDYQKCVGVKVIFADGVLAEEFGIDASVHYKKDNAVFVSLDRKVRISKNGEHDGINITAVNIPAKINKGNDSATIKFLDGGMMSVTVDGTVKTTSSGWETTIQNGKTVFTKFGKADILKIEG